MICLNRSKKVIISFLMIFTILIPILVQAIGIGTAYIKASDEASGIEKIVMPDGSEIKKEEAEFNISKYGLYKFVAHDKAGNNTTEYILELPLIGLNSSLLEIEVLIWDIEKEINPLVNNENKDKLIDKLNKLKLDFDNEVQRRIKAIEKDIRLLSIVDEKEVIKRDINLLPNEYKVKTTDQTITEEKIRLSKLLDDKVLELENKNKLEIATLATEKAETTLVITDLELAREKVNLLDDGEDKTKLLDRLDKVEKLINLINKIKDDIKNLEDLKDKDKIQKDIDTLPAGDIKDNLQKDLDKAVSDLEKIENSNTKLKEATELVKIAEDTIKQVDVDKAINKVIFLDDNKDRDDLFDRLSIVQELVYAIERIDKDIDNMTSREDKKFIQRDIDRLPSCREKDRLQDKLDNKYNNLKDKDKSKKNDDYDYDLDKATDAVEKAEETIRQKDVDSAWKLVKKLPSSRDKDRLKKRLDDVQDKIDKKEDKKDKDNDYDYAIELVEKAERTLAQRDVDTARSAVKDLDNGLLKDSLNKRLDLVQKMIDLQNKLIKDDSKDNNKTNNDKDNKEVNKPIVDEKIEYEESNIGIDPSLPEIRYAKYTNNSSIGDYIYNYDAGFNSEEEVLEVAKNDNRIKPQRKKQSKFFKLKEPKFEESIENKDMTKINRGVHNVNNQDKNKQIKESDTKAKSSNKLVFIIPIVVIIIIGTLGVKVFRKKK